MTPLQPVDPEIQKCKQLLKYKKQFLISSNKFTLPVQKRYKCLLQSVSYTCYSRILKLRVLCFLKNVYNEQKHESATP